MFSLLDRQHQMKNQQTILLYYIVHHVCFYSVRYMMGFALSPLPSCFLVAVLGIWFCTFFSSSSPCLLLFRTTLWGLGEHVIQGSEEYNMQYTRCACIIKVYVHIRTTNGLLKMVFEKRVSTCQRSYACSITCKTLHLYLSLSLNLSRPLPFISCVAPLSIAIRAYVVHHNNISHFSFFYVW